MKPETDKELDQRISRGKTLWISSFIYDVIQRKVEIGFTPEPDSVECDRKLVFRDVSRLRADHHHDCEEDEICYGSFMGIHRDIFQPAGKRAEFLLFTGDSEVQFHAAAEAEAIFLPEAPKT
jgi:hypothetical protein